ncbi:acyl-CoA dehydrogenase family protein [Streptomyces sp. NPDC015684]|uniref:acyl-CoA dehydrogenase family protein n=1 Tax=Streptomyces sp. NPDC015684 TaxID=3364963 RepID=UPI0036F523D5
MTVTADEVTDAGAGQVDWLHIAREMADDLATDAAEREQAGKPPLDEVARLRESGLLTLLAPAEQGGGGADWRTAYTVVRTVAAADGAIGHLLGHHYFLSFTARFFADPARAARVERESTSGQWCWGGGIASHEPPLVLTPTASGHLLNGYQRYATGVGIADRLVVRAARYGTGEPLAVLVDPTHPGVVSGSSGDTFGQRLAAGGAVEFDSVPVAADDVFGSLSPDEGAWPGSPPQDPYALTVYGELAVVARAASALAEQAVDALLRGLAQHEDLHDEECAEIAVLASVAEAAASRAAQEITNRALEVVGVEAASMRHGFDRFWRDARTHTLREPAAHRLREIGDYFLNGAHPSFVLPA